MRTKAIMLSLVILILVCGIILCACEKHEEIEREIVDYRYTPAHEEIIVTYTYIYNGKTVQPIPNIYTVHQSEKYELLYRIFYDDGCVTEKWEECTADEYKEANYGKR